MMWGNLSPTLSLKQKKKKIVASKERKNEKIYFKSGNTQRDNEKLNGQSHGAE